MLLMILHLPYRVLEGHVVVKGVSTLIATENHQFFASDPCLAIVLTQKSPSFVSKKSKVVHSITTQAQ